LLRGRSFGMRAGVPYKDPERQRAYGRDWMRRNADKARAAMRRWRAAHPEEHAKDNREYYVRHREERLAQSAEYHSDHPEVGRARWQNYRTRKIAAEGAFTAQEWLALVAMYGGRCAYCGIEGPLEADHRIPLSRGGTNRIENILPACRSCNGRKHRMTEEEFRARLASEQGDDLQSD
jgi:5-methylcytosine-specific restriction endonuclease McrA